MFDSIRETIDYAVENNMKWNYQVNHVMKLEI